MLDSVHIARELTAQDFKVEAPAGKNNVNVIGVVQDQAPTRHLKLDLDIVSGAVELDITRDIAKVAVIDRHSGSGRIQTGFIQGFGFEGSCAVGSTIAHDSHQLVVVGTDESNMAVAANVLARIGGGQIVVRDGVPIAQVELPIAGLMSTERAEVVAMKMDRLHDALDTCGCRINNANQLYTLAHYP
jgi:adenine deaminase